eukprot:Awhi_evm1s8554
MKFLYASLALVGAATAAPYHDSYKCVSVDKRATDKWCQTNCLSLDGVFNDHSACFVDYSYKTAHTVCKCEDSQHAYRETEKKEKIMTPEEPEFYPEEPEFYPEEPEFYPEEPEFYPEEPEFYPEEPEFYPEEPEFYPEEPEFYPEEPEFYPEEPEFYPEEPEFYPEEPEFYPEEP